VEQQILGLSGRIAAGKNASANFLVGLVMLYLSKDNTELPGEFEVSNDTNGKLRVPFKDEDGSIFFDIFDLEAYHFSQEMELFLAKNVWPYMKLYSFADPLKEFCVNVFGLKPEQMWGTQEQKQSLTELRWEDMPNVITQSEIRQYEIFETSNGRSITDEIDEYMEWLGQIVHEAGYMTAREVLQYFGTNMCRKMKPDCWVHATINKIQHEQSLMAVITDVRFPDEVRGIQQVGGKVIRFLRNPENQQHESETALDGYDSFDEIIDNSEMNVVEQNQAVLEVLKKWGWFQE